VVIELSLTFDLYLVLDSGSGVSISYRDPSRQPVHHSVDISLEVQYESRTGYTKDISEPQVPLFTTRALIYSCVRSFSSYSSIGAVRSTSSPIAGPSVSIATELAAFQIIETLQRTTFMKAYLQRNAYRNKGWFRTYHETLHYATDERSVLMSSFRSSMLRYLCSQLHLSCISTQIEAISLRADLLLGKILTTWVLLLIS
jgi:hypothetical protein